jgi:hypothetical protein
VSANEVVGVTEILTPYSSTIEAYSATELGANVSAYYDGYVEGYLYQNATLVAVGYGGQGAVASGYLEVVTVPYSSYQMQSDHYLIAFFSFFNIDSGETEYENPEAFTSGSGGGGGDGSGYFEPGGGSPYRGVLSFLETHGGPSTPHRRRSRRYTTPVPPYRQPRARVTAGILKCSATTSPRRVMT